MTTIAFDGRYLAADTRGIYGHDGLCLLPCRKLEVSDACAYAATGRITPGWRRKLIEWWRFDGADPAKIPPCGAGDWHDAGAFIVADSKGIVSLHYGLPYAQGHGVPCGWGSGADYAIGAMEAGYDAMRAVAVAMKHDTATGGEVEFIDTHAMALGVQIWDRPLSMYLAWNMAVAPGGFEYIEPSKPAAVVPQSIAIRKPRSLEGVWQTPECEGRLALGTGCGHCLRCNREWRVLQKKGGTLQVDTLVLPAEAEAPNVTSPRQVLETLVGNWNAASARHDRQAQRGFDAAFRSLQFPPGVEMVTDQPDDEHDHFRRRLVWRDGSGAA